MAEEIKAEKSHWSEKAKNLRSIYKSAKELADSQPEKFAFYGHENEYYAGIINARTELVHGGNNYKLMLTLLDSKKGEDFTQELQIRDESGTYVLYRLDISTGPETKRFYEKIQKAKQQQKYIPEEMERDIFSMLDLFTVETNGEVTKYMSLPGADMSDKEALDILTSSMELRFPSDMKDYPTLKDMREGLDKQQKKSDKKLKS